MTISKRRIWTATLALLGLARRWRSPPGSSSRRPATPPGRCSSSRRPPQALLRHRRPGAGSAAEFAMFQKTQVELLKSRFVLGKALSHPNVAKLPSVVRRPDPVRVARGRAHPHLRRRAALHRARERRSAGSGQAGQRRDRRLHGRGRQRRQQSAQATPRRTQGNLDRLTEKMRSIRRTREVLAERAGSNDRETVEYRNQLAMERASRAEQDLRALRNQLREARIDLAILQVPPRAQPQPKGETTDDATARSSSPPKRWRNGSSCSSRRRRAWSPR